MASLPAYSELNTPAGLGKLNGYLSLRSYVVGYFPTQADVELAHALKDVKLCEKKQTHAVRFLKHINSFTAAEQKAWPSEGTAAVEADEDEMDLFASDDEEDEAAAAALQEKIAAEKAARKAGKGKGERSLIVLEVKPFDAETDLEKMAKGIKTIEHEGIQNWGQEYKLIPVAFGIKKLAISAVVYDNLMDVDTLSDLIESKYGDDVQSIDVQAMSKV
mmetsp:Transcript_15847/g.25882  ORF Transcript_15847/g.25882 Transcript_15847/m.25882 type:complete len:218 (-) Transcript_15847:43-696(-)|eukprot:CAMPEP_0203794090 /NCGR_PEP_ID=MMETSP0100_2-20121128/6277_1 /ASSEMBLY_ACC=CAM_ASM_000210 /TAXON_ID=96639 /ORGANISM=" , Strain NY0313808BC1" /LENGTH=217 /DNA_ID=CAMNT_0050698041 /DNA_START=51 /DNA_END=704 /DNA_ORIENTATION=+